MRTGGSSRRCSTRCSTTRRWPTNWARMDGRSTTAHYEWPVIERAYLDMFERLAAGTAGQPRWSRSRAGWPRRAAHRAGRRRCRGRARPRGPVRDGRERETVVKLAFITPALRRGPHRRARARLPSAGRAHRPSPRHRRAHDVRARFADVEERVPRGAGPGARRARPPLPGHRARSRSGGVRPAWRPAAGRAALAGRGARLGAPARARGRRGCSIISSGSTATTTPWCSSG